jgi:hypothetical protein
MNVRLQAWEIEEIKKSFKECFDEGDHLWLFGSRVYPEKRGGDIDLYIEVANFDFKKVYDQKSKFWINLQDHLGEQKIDIVIRDPKQDLLIYKVAQEEGVRIV